MMIGFQFVTILFCLFNTVYLLPQYQKARRPGHTYKSKLTGGLTLPYNATSIRASIVDTFSCENKIYGFYADMENDCQVFHVCIPQRRNFIRWSFICPAETVFNQATFVCTRTRNSIRCKDSINYYHLNQELGTYDDIILGTVNNSLNIPNKHFRH